MDKRKEKLKRAIRKKKFVYKEVSSRSTGFGGSNVKAEIFKISKNTLTKVGDVKWNYTTGQSFNEELINIMHIGSGKQNNWWADQRIW